MEYLGSRSRAQDLFFIKPKPTTSFRDAASFTGIILGSKAGGGEMKKIS